MKQFTLYWLDGKREIVEGADPADAMNNAGYGAGAVRALDFYAPGDDKQWRWDAEAKDWDRVITEDLDEEPSLKGLMKKPPALREAGLPKLDAIYSGDDGWEKLVPEGWEVIQDLRGFGLRNKATNEYLYLSDGIDALRWVG